MHAEPDAEFGTILKEHAAVMYRQALRILGNREDAEDAVQDAMVRIWKHRRAFRGRSAVSTWIFRITYNACCALKARRQRAGKVESALLVEEAAALAVQSRREAPPANLDDITRLLSLLPPVQAAALSLFYVEELEYKEIARVLKIPPGSVATAIHRGKDRLREILKHERGESDERL